LTIDSSDVRSHGNEQIINAVEILRTSEDRRKVFKEIYRGRNGKTSDEIASKIHMDKIRVLQEARKLDKSQLIAKKRVKGKLLFLRVDYFSLNRDKILRQAVSKSAREKFREKLNGKSTNVIIKLPIPRKAVDIQHLTIDDIDSFEKVANVHLKAGEENKPVLEKVFKNGLQKIIGEQGEFKD
jgi:predicted transcriptional regulator